MVRAEQRALCCVPRKQTLPRHAKSMACCQVNLGEFQGMGIWCWQARMKQENCSKISLGRKVEATNGWSDESAPDYSHVHITLSDAPLPEPSTIFHSRILTLRDRLLAALASPHSSIYHQSAPNSPKFTSLTPPKPKSLSGLAVPLSKNSTLK